MGKQEQLIEYIIQDKETGLYMESSEYVYDLFKDEINFGRIVQAEI